MHVYIHIWLTIVLLQRTFLLMQESQAMFLYLSIYLQITEHTYTHMCISTDECMGIYVLGLLILTCLYIYMYSI